MLQYSNANGEKDIKMINNSEKSIGKEIIHPRSAPIKIRNGMLTFGKEKSKKTDQKFYQKI